MTRSLTTGALRGSALVTTDAHHLVETLEGFGIQRERLRVLMFGTDVERFSPGDGRPMRERHRLAGAPVVISTRTLEPVHDVATFVRAMPGIRAGCPDARFIVVADGSERARLEALVEALDAREAVRFTGMVEEAEMRDLLRASDVYVSTSRYDAGLASSTGEAMACGLPVVTTENSDNARWLPDGDGGFLVPNGRRCARGPGAAVAQR